MLGCRPERWRKARIEQFNEAIREGDQTKYADVFVEDFVFTSSPNGGIYTLEAILPNVVPTPEFRPEVDEVLVRVYGNAAVVNFRTSNTPDAPPVCVTFSFARVDGRWKAIAYQSTQIADGEA